MEASSLFNDPSGSCRVSHPIRVLERKQAFNFMIQVIVSNAYCKQTAFAALYRDYRKAANRNA